MAEAHPEGIRLQKVLAAAGIGSRRACEDLIAQGRVEVDGSVVIEMGTRVDPDTAVVRVDGERINVAPSIVHLAFNKPLGVVTTMSDDRGRPCVGDYVKKRHERLFHVGRLDSDTEGLLLLTNDGDLSHRLSHPSYDVPKVYLVEVAGSVPRDLGRRLRDGLELDDGPAAVDAFRVIQSGDGRTLVELTVHEGRNRIVRRLMDEAGHPVRRLVRTQVGPVHLGDLRSGSMRTLNRSEVAALYALVGL
jgi:23S rRNA pseudouridine2605 synthase